MNLEGSNQPLTGDVFPHACLARASGYDNPLQSPALTYGLQPTKVDFRFYEPKALAEFIRCAKIG
jgi:hypothetical protein